MKLKLWYHFIIRFFRRLTNPIKWYFQRANRGFSDYDAWDFFTYWLDMLDKAIEFLQTDKSCVKAIQSKKTIRNYRIIQEYCRRIVDDHAFNLYCKDEDTYRWQVRQKEYKESLCRLLQRYLYQLWD